MPNTLEEAELELTANPETSLPEKVWTTVEESPDHPIARLIRLSEQCQNRWNIEELWQSNAIRPATYRTLCQERPCFVSRKLPPKSSPCDSQPDPLTNASSLEGETKCPEKTALISHFSAPPLVSFGQASHPDRSAGD